MSLTSSNFGGEVDPKLSNIKPKKNEVQDFTFKADFTYVYPSKDILDVGVKISRIKTTLFLQNSFGETANISGRMKKLTGVFMGSISYRVQGFNC